MTDDEIDNLGEEPEEQEERLHPILSNEEFLAAQSAARKAIEKERKLLAREAVIEAETQRLRNEEGLTTGIEDEDRIVDVTIDLPPWAPNIAVNFGTQPYWPGRTYQVPLHVARSLQEQMFRAWRHEDQLDGKSLQQKLMRKRETVINARSGAIANAPRPFDA